MEPKRHPKINDFLARFSDPSGNIDGTSTELRGDCEGTSGVTLSPADPPGRRHIIKDYCTIISKDGWLAGSNTPRAVGPANYREPGKAPWNKGPLGFFECFLGGIRGVEFGNVFLKKVGSDLVVQSSR